MKFTATNLFTAGAVALGLGLASVPAKAQEFINVLTGGTSGVYYPLGVALSEIYGQNIENLLQAGRGEIGFSLGDSVQEAWAGNTEAGFPGKLDKLRGIAAIYPNYIQIVASKESGVTDLEGLKGRSLSVGAPASGTELNARAIFEAAGLTYEDLGKLEYLPFAESVELIKNRQLDATLQSAGLGVASIRDLATSLPINVVAVAPEIVEEIGAPFLSVTIPAGTYDGQDEDVPTAAVGNFLVSHEGVSEETAYQMTKLLFENLEKMAASHAAAKDIDVNKALDGMPIPLHPGAERYYREVGVLK